MPLAVYFSIGYAAPCVLASREASLRGGMGSRRDGRNSRNDKRNGESAIATCEECGIMMVQS